DKGSAANRSRIEKAVAHLKKDMEGSDVEAIKAKTEALKQASYKLAEEMYKQTQAEAGGPQTETESTAGSSSDTVKNAEDADFEVVD
ncbi:MAG TPA: molecular chaperone DnaK, partial [Sphaerochaeta sp.]|nr:molecular chaperone DnaK [Sphaerochaeta sp.]